MLADVPASHAPLHSAIAAVLAGDKDYPADRHARPNVTRSVSDSAQGLSLIAGKLKRLGLVLRGGWDLIRELQYLASGRSAFNRLLTARRCARQRPRR
jgi:hypothetical protein